jgi:DHA1 family multidrug resistance protein-like MFS transporter
MRLAIDACSDHVGHRPLIGLPVAIWSMLVTAFTMSVGFYMLIPLVSVYYTDSLGFSAAMVGLALAVRQFSQQGLMLLTGSVAERFGYRPVLAAGMLVRSSGFALFVIADTLPRLLLASFVAALGGAFFEVSARALMATLVPSEQRTQGFSLWSLSSNVGLAIGPLVGSLLLRASFSTVCLVAASTYIAGATATMLLVPPGAGSRVSIAKPPGLIKTVGTVIRDRTFVAFSVIMCGYYLMGTQLYITIPLETERLTGSTGILGLVYLVNSLVAIGLQFPLVRWASRYLTTIQTIVRGIALLAISLGSLVFASGLWLILVSVALLAAGKVLVEPVMNTSVASIASKAGDGLLASYFGFSALSIAVGGATGQLFGGWLYDLAESTSNPTLPWLVLGIAGAIVTLAMLLFSRTSGARRMNIEDTQPAAS